ncbi:hypothetical protein ACTNDS_15270 [Blautia sp. HCP3S3_C12]|uniref:hypothetical protein n=1 Tax=unclassified Blautia TaxID=2648079 RepID=UPI003F8BD5D2
MEQLWKDNDIYLFYFYNNEDEKNASQVLNEHCKSVKGYKREKSIVKLLISYIRYPYTVSTRINPEFIKDVEKCIATEDIDIINIDFPQMGYLAKSKNNQFENDIRQIIRT